MKRPVQHQIDDIACQQFKQCLPSQWVMRSQSHDYGIDGEVEVFNISDDKGAAESTGTIFKVQIKGTKSPTISSSKNRISFQLEIEKVRYLCEELRIPTIFIVGDITSKATYWYAPQTDEELRCKLSKENKANQKSLAIHIPLENRLPDSLSDLLTKIVDIGLFLSNDCITKASIHSFVGMLSNLKDVDSTLENYQKKIAAIRVEKIERLWRKGEYDSVKKEIDIILSNLESSTEIKFAAILYEEKLLLSSLTGTHPSIDEDRIKVGLHIANKLKFLSKKGPPHLKLFASIIFRASQLQYIANKDFYLFLNSKIHKSDTTKTDTASFALFILEPERRFTSQRVIRKYNQCIKLLSLIPKIGAYNILSNSLARISVSIIQFCLRLRDEGLIEAAESYKKAILDISDMAIEIAKCLKQWDDIALTALNSVWLWDTKNEEVLNNALSWSQKRLEMISDLEVRKEALNNLENIRSKLANQNKIASSGEFSIEQEREIYTQMAKSHGIDLNDPDDPISQVVRIGLQDLDPGRVLRNCVHLFVSLGSCGIPGQMLGLPTAGSKYIHCTKHGYGIGALMLDSAYKTLYDEYCKKCPDKQPHPGNWHWTRPWQQRQDEIYSSFAKRTKKK